jgi:hypothetical protein
MGPICLIFGHRRSRNDVRYDRAQSRWVSCCKRCSEMMIRDSWPGLEWHASKVATLRLGREPVSECPFTQA